MYEYKTKFGTIESVAPMTVEDIKDSERRHELNRDTMQAIRREIAKMPAGQNISGITACPGCGGRLRWWKNGAGNGHIGCQCGTDRCAKFQE